MVGRFHQLTKRTYTSGNYAIFGYLAWMNLTDEKAKRTHVRKTDEPNDLYITGSVESK